MGKLDMIKLGDLCSVITKGTTPTTIGYEFQNNGINFIKIESISDNGTFIINKFEHISDECNQKMKRSQLSENDILFSIAGAIGKIGYVTKDILPANTNQALAIIRLNSKNILHSYLIYCLKSNIIMKQYDKNKQGVAQINLSLKNISDLQIPLPHIETQKQIAENLDKVTRLIDLCNAILEKLDLLVKARFVEMFGTLENPLEDFNIDILKNLCIKITDGKHGGCMAEEGSQRYFVGAREIYDDSVHYDTAPEINISEFEKDYKRCNVEIGDFLIVNTGATIGKSAIATDEKTKYTLLQKSVALLKVKKELLNTVFLKWCYRVNERMYKVDSASAQPNLLLSKINSTEIYVPPIKLQNQFADFVKQTDKTKLKVKQLLEKAETLKKALMQEYFG